MGKVRDLCDAYDAAFMHSDWKAAETSVRQALVLCPFDCQALWRFAQLLGHHGDYNGAADYANRAVGADPNDSNAWAVLSGALSPLGRIEECHYAASRAQQLTGLFPMAQWNLAHSQLRLGDYKNGFRNYEWGPVIGFRRKHCIGPQWDGTAIPGNKLYIWAEQGLGDGIMFNRFVKEAKERSQAYVVLEVHKPLFTLLRGQSGADFVFAQPQFGTVPYEAADYDYHVSVASLPYVLGKEQGDITGGPYIGTVPGMDVDNVANGRVGLVWKGSRTHANDRMRSIPIEYLKVLENDADWVSIQGGSGEFPFPMPDLGSCLSDMAFTASLLTQLDLLVTCDTSVAHLAGAMGIDTVMVAPLNGEWRWGMEGSRTCWYDSVTVIRPSSWIDAVRQVKAALKSRGLSRTVYPEPPIDPEPMIERPTEHKNGKVKEPALV